MLNQRASIFSVHSHSNASLIHQKHMKKHKSRKKKSTSIDYFEILNLKEIDQTIIHLLKQYLCKRTFIVICSFLIITLITLNSIFLLIHTYDCKIFDLCTIDDEDDAEPFFFWILIGVKIFIKLKLQNA